ncbi:hypothetical protein AB0B45_22670 [Nonomuraea sp. NPDC049152]|uniref:hypothetical protein n=1 Tax=Nonomuraea sp. NPDC049152 TaxID=3154350 RepID=UPI0033BFE38B
MTRIAPAGAADLAQLDQEHRLVRLRDQLVLLGVNAELRDDNTALMVHRPAPGLPVWVFVGYGGVSYSWQNANKRHPVDDPRGAAAVLAEYVAR